MSERTRWHDRIFALSWLSYLSYYFTRTNFSAAKKDLQADLGVFLHELARQLNIDDDRAGEATQPGSLISVHA